MSGFLPGAADRVEQVMRRWPQTIRVFLNHGMACVGCSFGDYHTVEHAAQEHGVSLASLLRELRRAAACGPPEAPRLGSEGLGDRKE